MDNYKVAVKPILKKYIQYFLCSAAVIQIIFVVLFIYMDNQLFSIVNGILAIVNLLIFACTYRISFDIVKPLINLYLVFISFHIYLFIFIYWKQSVVSFAWLLLIPIGILNIFSFRVVIYWTLYILFLIALTFITPDVFGLREKYSFSADYILIVNVIIILFVFYLSFLIAYFSNKISVLRLESISRSKGARRTAVPDSADNKEKYMELYDQIMMSFEKEKPFLSADFNISQLAISLNSNSTYISKTINTCTGMNFNTFVNTYRINRSKELLNRNELNKFTLVHIYTLAGFKHQSTFNKAFKQIEGISPTKYLRQAQD